MSANTSDSLGWYLRGALYGLAILVVVVTIGIFLYSSNIFSDLVGLIVAIATIVLAIVGTISYQENRRLIAKMDEVIVEMDRLITETGKPYKIKVIQDRLSRLYSPFIFNENQRRSAPVAYNTREYLHVKDFYENITENAFLALPEFKDALKVYLKTFEDMKGEEHKAAEKEALKIAENDYKSLKSELEKLIVS